MNKSTNNQLNGQRLLKHVQTREWVGITKICIKGTIVSLGLCWIYILQSAILTLRKVASAATPSNYPCLIGKNTKQRALRKITLSIIIIIIIIIIFLRCSEDKALAWSLRLLRTIIIGMANFIKHFTW